MVRFTYRAEPRSPRCTVISKILLTRRHDASIPLPKQLWWIRDHLDQDACNVKDGSQRRKGKPLAMGSVNGVDPAIDAPSPQWGLQPGMRMHSWSDADGDWDALRCTRSMATNLQCVKIGNLMPRVCSSFAILKSYENHNSWYHNGLARDTIFLAFTLIHWKNWWLTFQWKLYGTSMAINCNR